MFIILIVTSAKSLEVSFDQKEFYIGGTFQKKWAVIGNILFDQSLTAITFSKIQAGDYKCVNCIKRIDSTDVLIVGAYKALLIFKYIKKAQKFSLIFCFEKDKSDPYEIDNCFFHTNTLIFYGKVGNILTILKFKKSLNQDSFNKKEYEKIQERKN